MRSAPTDLLNSHEGRAQHRFGRRQSDRLPSPAKRPSLLWNQRTPRARFLTTQGAKTSTAKTLSDCTARSKPGSTELLDQSHSALLKVSASRSSLPWRAACSILKSRDEESGREDGSKT